MQGFCLSNMRASKRTSSPRAAQKKDVVVVIPSDQLIFRPVSQAREALFLTFKHLYLAIQS